MEKHYRNSIRKYFVLCTIVGIILISLWFAVCLVIPGYISSIFSLLVMLFLMKVTIEFIANKTLVSVLVKELDATSFQAIVSDSRFIAPITYRTIAAISTGDYQTAINIATKQIGDKKSRIQQKYYNLSLLARIYFELRDFEKLNLILKKYDELNVLHSSNKNVNTTNSTWDYYRCFLECNFEACQEICKSKENTLKNKSVDNNYYILINDFYYAVACYSSGNKEKAEVIFDKIIHAAPKMHLSNISQRYVDSINFSSELTVIDEIIPKINYQLYDSRTAKKIRCRKIITRILLIIFCSLMIFSSIIDFVEQNRQEPEYNSALAEYENKLNSALSKNYDNAKVVSYFNIKHEEKHIDTFCLIEDGDRLDLASIVTYDGGESLDILHLIEIIQIPYDYSVKSAVSNYKITFSVFDKQISDSKNNDTIEFSSNNKNYCFVIKNITPLN